MQENKFIGFGGAALSGVRSYYEVSKLLLTAYDYGIRHFDTAPLYGRGYSELIIGKVFKNKRDDITIATKFGLTEPGIPKFPLRLAMPLNYYRRKWRPAAAGQEVPPHLLQPRKITSSDIKNNFYNSLKRLKTDYLDYYFLHEALPAFLDNEALNFLFSLKEKGLVRKIGIGIDSYNFLKADKKQFNGWDIFQYNIHPLADRDSIQQAYPDKVHFHHSCLKNLDNITTENIPANKKRRVCACKLRPT